MSTSPVVDATVHPDVETVLFTRAEIAARVRELARQISADFAGRELHVVGVLRGAALFAADLLRELDATASLDFIAISTYGTASSSSGVVRIVKDLDDSVDGRCVLVVEDIIDTGLTLNYLTELLRRRNVAELKVCALLDKPSARKTEARADYVGFTVPDAFVIGYGLDYNQRYRGLPYIGTLRATAIKGS